MNTDGHIRGLWTAQEVASATGGQIRSDWVVSGISIDSRTISEGDLFIALTAARDGHEFVASALERGAAAAMVSHIPEGMQDDLRLVLVDDVQTGLEALGRSGRARMAGRVLAITGSVGKTSAKEMARFALSGQGNVHIAEASYNNHWGVPLTLARMPADTDYAVIEIGMNHPGETAPLAMMARPHVALITTIAPAHLEAFPDGLEGIAREKSYIFKGVEAGGTAVIPKGLPQSGLMEGIATDLGLRVVGFGPQTATDNLTGEGQTHALGLTLPGAGQHMAQNALGVMAACVALGINPPEVVQGISRWSPVSGRGAVEVIGDLTVIDDSFNANPASLSAGLAMLASREGEGRRVAILGEMLELGEDAEAFHAAIADDPAMASVDIVHSSGPLMCALMEALPPAKRGLWVASSDAFVERLPELTMAGDIVLIKGSKSSRVSQVVDALRHASQIAGTERKEQ